MNITKYEKKYLKYGDRIKTSGSYALPETKKKRRKPKNPVEVAR